MTSTSSASWTKHFAVLVGAFVTLAIAGHALAQSTMTWVGPTSGNQIWNDTSNWDLAAVPNYPVYPGDTAIIGDTTADRNITTPNTSWNIGYLTMTQSATAVGVNKLTLGADFNMAPNYNNLTITNDPANAPSQLVVDLNGHRLGGYVSLGFSNITLRNSGPSGVGSVETNYGLGIGANTVVESNVRVIHLGTAYQDGYSSGTWMPGSTVVMRGAVWGYLYMNPGSEYYDMEIGEAGTATQGSYNPYWVFPNTDFTVKHNVTIFEPTSAPSNPLILDGQNLVVGGNFVDHGLAGDPSYTGAIGTPHSSFLVFNGNPGSANTVDIARQLTSDTIDIRVGNSTSDKGSIKLAQNLTMAGNFHVTNGSALDVANKTLTVGGFLQEPTAGETSIDLTYTLGPTVGIINVNGDLTLNDFVLNVNQFNVGDWDGTHTLTLFTYTGSLIGTPNIAIGDVNTTTGLFRYTSLVAGGGVVQLLGAEVPEPASLGLLAIGGAALIRRRRHTA